MKLFGINITFIDTSDNEEWRYCVPGRLIELGMGEEVYHAYAEEYGEDDEDTQWAKKEWEQYESRSLLQRFFGS